MQCIELFQENLSPYERRSFDSNDDLDLPELHDRSYVTSDASHRSAPADQHNDDVFRGASHDDIDAQQVPVPFMQRAEEIVQEVMQDFRLSQSDASSSYDEVSDVGEAYDDFATNDAQLRGDARRPPVTGKSLFTQEEFSNQHHSLAEFEKMEAEMERGTGAREEADHDADVIGAYLQGKSDSTTVAITYED